MVEQVTVTEAFGLKNTLFIDARTPKEYAEDCILEAINVPLLSNEERHEIGIIYKQKSRKEAIEKGLKLFPEKIPSIYNAVKDHQDKTIIVYCARGGMRSKIIASLLESIGFNVLQLEGGYKHFRHYILKELNNFELRPKLVCLYGLTCTGKTDLLKKLPNSLDLEGLAQHRGSLYGAVGLQPNSQKRFENLLLKRLRELNDEEVIFIEGESRKIGNAEIPSFLFKAMKNGKNLLIVRSIENRVSAVVREYFSTPEMVKQIREITPSLKDVISKEKKLKVVSLIDARDYSGATKILLEDYYDLLYVHTLKKIEFFAEVCSDDVDEGVEEIISLEKIKI